MKIRNMLVLLFSIMSIFPIITVGILSFYSGSNSIQERQLYGLTSVLHSKMDHIINVLQMKQNQTKLIANSYLCQNMKADGKNDAALIKNLQTELEALQLSLNMNNTKVKGIENVSMINSITIYDAQGLAKASSNKRYLGDKLTTNEIEQQKAKLNSFPVYQYDSVSGKGQLCVWETIVNANNEYVGVAKTILSSKILDEILLHRDGMGESGEFYLVQKNDSRVHFITPLRFNDDPSDIAIGDKRAVSAQNALAGIAGSGLATNYMGVSTFSIWEKIPNLDLGIVVESSRNETLLPIFGLRNKIFIIGIFELILSIIFAILYSKLFSIPMAKFVKSFEKISKGELKESINIKNNNILDKFLCQEFILLSKTGNESIDYLKSVVHQANLLCVGDYSQNIAPKSEIDELGIALEEMTNNLRDYDKTSKETIWLQTGLTNVTSKLKGELQKNELSVGILNEIVPYIGAQVGAIYVFDERRNVLTFSAGYAFEKTAEIGADIKPGQGLVGQAALEKKIITYSEIPSNYIKIYSSLGGVIPKNIVIVPFVTNGKLIGAMEICTANKFTELHMQLLIESKDDIAIAYLTAENRIKINELLHQSQIQAEELQAQAEELRVQQEELMETNASLELQAEKLKESEEELKVKQEELLESTKELEEKSKLLMEEKNTLQNEKNSEINKIKKELEIKTDIHELRKNYK